MLIYNPASVETGAVHPLTPFLERGVMYALQIAKLGHKSFMEVWIYGSAEG